MAICGRRVSPVPGLQDGLYRYPLGCHPWGRSLPGRTTRSLDACQLQGFCQSCGNCTICHSDSIALLRRHEEVLDLFGRLICLSLWNKVDETCVDLPSMSRHQQQHWRLQILCALNLISNQWWLKFENNAAMSTKNRHMSTWSDRSYHRWFVFRCSKGKFTTGTETSKKGNKRKWEEYVWKDTTTSKSLMYVNWWEGKSQNSFFKNLVAVLEFAVLFNN